MIANDARSRGWVAMCVLGFSLLAIGAPGVAYANDLVSAQALFDEARRLMAKGAYAQACPKLAESQRLAPGIGTLFNLADCYEHTGRLAAAWATYLEVAAETKAAGQPRREEVARDRAIALEPRLCHLTITTSNGPRASGLVVRLDDVVVGASAFGVPVPIDPGIHTVGATADGRRPWRADVEIAGEGRSLSVDVPDLEMEIATPARDEPRPVPSRDGGGWDVRRIAGLTLFGLGGAGLVTAGYFTFKSVSDKTSANPDCQGNVCDSTGFDLRTAAVHEGNAATLAFGLGAAAVAAGAVLWFTAPRAEAATRAARARTGVSASSRGVGLSIVGSW